LHVSDIFRSLRCRCAPAYGSKEGAFRLLTRHLSLSAQARPRERTGLLSDVPLTRNCGWEKSTVTLYLSSRTKIMEITLLRKDGFHVEHAHAPPNWRRAA